MATIALAPESGIIVSHRRYNNRFFARWAACYSVLQHLLQPLRNRAADLFGEPRGSVILDVATGTGDQALALARRGYRVLGVDLSPAMLAQARKRRRPGLALNFLQSDATSLPFADAAFDASVISLALHDMPRQVGLLVLEEMRRVTQPGGAIMIVEYAALSRRLVRLARPFISLYESKYFNFFLQGGLDALLAESGLDAARDTTVFGVFRIVIARNR